MKKLLPLLTVATGVMFFAGCASSGYEKASRTTTSLQAAAQGIDQALTPLGNVQLALSDLVDNPGTDLTAQFKKYRDAVSQLESVSDEVSDHATAMKTRGAAYFDQWDSDLAKIQNEDIHTRSLDRKNAVSARFERVRVSYAQATADFVPLMSDLKDIRTALSTDLTTAGLASIRSLASKANDKMPPLRTSLIRLSADFKDLGVALSPGTASN